MEELGCREHWLLPGFQLLGCHSFWDAAFGLQPPRALMQLCWSTPHLWGSYTPMQPQPSPSNIWANTARLGGAAAAVLELTTPRLMVNQWWGANEAGKGRRQSQSVLGWDVHCPHLVLLCWNGNMGAVKIWKANSGYPKLRWLKRKGKGFLLTERLELILGGEGETKTNNKTKKNPTTQLWTAASVWTSAI